MEIEFLNSLSDPTMANELLLGVFKFFLVVCGLLYMIFSFVILRQIKIMRGTLITPFSPIIRTLGIIHLILAGGVLVLFVVVL